MKGWLDEIDLQTNRTLVIFIFKRMTGSLAPFSYLVLLDFIKLCKISQFFI